MVSFKPRTALVLTTTPPVPREYGNRNRVFQMIEHLRGAGFSISLMLYPLDEEWTKEIPDYYRQLRDMFDYFAIVPNSNILHRPAAAFHHEIDEWWDDAIGVKIKWLFEREIFDVFVVNYTFLSKAFTFAPKGVLKILDTHDIFAGRRETLAKYGVPPGFFYTTADREAVAFDRADAILAIKASEGAVIGQLTARQVITIPYWDDNPVEPPVPRRGPPPRFGHDTPLRLGFIGANNPVNVFNLRTFLRKLDRYVRLYDVPIEMNVAGSVCLGIDADYRFLRKLGRVASVADFYTSVDAIVAPLEFSTGIKIKVGEALVWRLPILATENAFDGYRSFHSTQSEASFDTLCVSIVALAYNEISFSDLVDAAEQAGVAARLAQNHGFEMLKTCIDNYISRILIVVDRPFWPRQTFIDEMIAQSVEYISQIASTVVVFIGSVQEHFPRVSSETDHVYLADAGEFDSFMTDFSAHFAVQRAVTFLSPVTRACVEKSLEHAAATVWNGEWKRDKGTAWLCFSSNVVSSGAFRAEPLRYAPQPSNPTLSPDLVAIFKPARMTEQQRLLISNVEKLCVDNALRPVVINVPEFAQFDATFFREAVGNDAARFVMLASDVVSTSFIFQIALYRGIRRHVLNDQFEFREGGDGQREVSALVEAMSQASAQLNAESIANDDNSGWWKLWAILKQERHSAGN